MRQILFLVLSLSAVAVSSAARFNYNGYKLLRVVAENQDQLNVLISLRDSYEIASSLSSAPALLNFWSEPAMHYYTDLMVSLTLLDVVNKRFKEHGMESTILMDDVERMIQNQLSLNQPSNENGKISWSAYNRYDEVAAWLNELSRNYSVASLESIGKSELGRDLHLLKISTGGNKSAIFIDGTFHAREWISPAVVTFFINELITNTSAYADLLDHLDFYFLPFVNPDGYEYTHTNDRMWRKTRAFISGTTCRGVDPNRNFDAAFGEHGSSTNPCAETYLGTSPFNIPETQALSEYLLKNGGNIKAYLSMHSYSQAWLTPYAYSASPPPNFTDILGVATDAVAALGRVYGTRYLVGPTSTTLYFHSGASQDWSLDSAKIKYTYTVELRDTGAYGFLLPPNQIVPTSIETWEGVKVVAKAVIAEMNNNK